MSHDGWRAVDQVGNRSQLLTRGHAVIIRYSDENESSDGHCGQAERDNAIKGHWS